MQALWKLQLWKDLYTIFDSEEVKNHGTRVQRSATLQLLPLNGPKKKI